MKKETNVKAACCSRSQKIWGAIALAGLFACGLFVGISMNGENSRSGSVVQDKQCNALAKQIVKISSYSNIGSNELNLLKELNGAYAENCMGYVADIEDKKHVPANQVAVQVMLPEQETCRVIETMMLGRLYPEDSTDVGAHDFNIETYKNLIEHGCPENMEKYQALIAREQDILAALTGRTENAEKTCAEIETLLMQSLPTHNLNHSDVRIERAKIYANLSERGCSENAQQYVDLAAKELEIARALRDDEFSQSETVEVVETYKRLEMKQAATEVLDKVQKLTDPAIDFIIQVQKIIEE